MKKEILLIVILALVVTAVYGYQQNRYEEEVTDLFEGVKTNFSQFRGCDLDNVSIRVVTTQWVKDRWGSQTVQEQVPQYLQNQELFFKSLMVVDDNFSYYQRKDQEVSGFMAFSWEGDVYVVKENFDPNSPGAGETLAHELEHLVQARQFNLENDGTYDGERAVGSIIEGDAILAGKLYAGKNISPTRSFEVDEDNSLNFMYMFSYNFGYPYIARLYNKEGYEGVNEVLRNYPITTEQIIHYNYSRNEFRELENDEFQGELAKEDRLGELMAFTFLAAHLNDTNARKAAEGWNGDSYVLYRDNDSFNWQWKIAWDSQSDAEEFYNASRDLLEKLGTYEGGRWAITQKYLHQEIEVVLSDNLVVLEGKNMGDIKI
ncbi:MAG: eCIS core domain-containing protein [Halobacteriota archaeon]